MGVPQPQRRTDTELPSDAAGEPARRSRRARSVLGGLLLYAAGAVGYLALAEYVRWLDDLAGLATGFRPGAGLAMAMLLLSPTRRWAWVVAAVVTAQTGSDLAHGEPLSAALWWAAGSALGPVVGALLIRRFVDPRGALVPLGKLLGFVVFGVLAGPAAGAVVSSVGSVVVMGTGFLQEWPRAALSGSLGVLVLAPALLTLTARHPPRSRQETAFLIGAFVVVSVLSPWAFRGAGGVWEALLPLLVLPLGLWAALRYGVRGAALASLWVTQRAVLATASGYGPFVAVSNSTAEVVPLLHSFLAFAPITSLALAVLVTDLGGRDKVEASLQVQAHHDTLTGLPNRAFLSVRLQAALDRARTGGRAVALLVCDLDGFKAVNDGLGHQAGDRVLVEVARRMRANVRPVDVVVRLSGDEFVILAEGADGPSIASLTDRLLTIMSEPIVLDAGRQVTVGLSIGVAISSQEHDSDTLLRDADAALYRAKDRGRGRAEHFDEELRAQAVERLSLPEELRAGLTREELHCVYQPEIEIGSGRLFAYEALVRWRHPDRGLLLPGGFIPLAESAGLVGAVFDRVLDETLRTQQRWATVLGFHPAVAVNLSTRQLHDLTLPARVAAALARATAPADLLWLEVTEGSITDDSSYETLAALHELGVLLAIDDFGTGWSSMARLSESAWDLLKIDRTFVARLTTDERAEHVVRAMILMAHALGIRTVAEGVETPQQLEILAGLGCDIAQGYLFAVPMDARAAIGDLAADGRWTASHRQAVPPEGA